MSKLIVSGLAACTLLVFPVAGKAQIYAPTRTTTIQIEYREPIPADGNMAALRTKIYAEVQTDCDNAAKAFQEKCSISSISFNDVGVNGQPPQGVIARAQLSLTPDAKPGNATGPN